MGIYWVFILTGYLPDDIYPVFTEYLPSTYLTGIYSVAFTFSPSKTLQIP